MEENGMALMSRKEPRRSVDERFVAIGVSEE
jgi:hypothetical protein